MEYESSDERKIAWWLMKTLIVVSHFTTLAFSGFYIQDWCPSIAEERERVHL